MKIISLLTEFLEEETVTNIHSSQLTCPLFFNHLTDFIIPRKKKVKYLDGDIGKATMKV